MAQDIHRPLRLIVLPNKAEANHTNVNSESSVISPLLIISGTRKAPTDEDRLEHQRKMNREKQKRFHNKVKGFIDISHKPTINERVKQLWLLSFPGRCDNIDHDALDALIKQFVDSAYALMSSPSGNYLPVI